MISSEHNSNKSVDGGGDDRRRCRDDAVRASSDRIASLPAWDGQQPLLDAMRRLHRAIEHQDHARVHHHEHDIRDGCDQHVDSNSARDDTSRSVPPPASSPMPLSVSAKKKGESITVRFIPGAALLQQGNSSRSKTTAKQELSDFLSETRLENFPVDPAGFAAAGGEADVDQDSIQQVKSVWMNLIRTIVSVGVNSGGKDVGGSKMICLVPLKQRMFRGEVSSGSIYDSASGDGSSDNYLVLHAGGGVESANGHTRDPADDFDDIDDQDEADVEYLAALLRRSCCDTTTNDGDTCNEQTRGQEEALLAAGAFASTSQRQQEEYDAPALNVFVFPSDWRF